MWCRSCFFGKPVTGLKYCIKCVCRVPDCANKKYHGDLCVAHDKRPKLRKCPALLCNNSIDCPKHMRCAHYSCDTVIKSDKRLCSRHRCVLDGCTNPKSGKYACETHRCYYCAYPYEPCSVGCIIHTIPTCSRHKMYTCQPRCRYPTCSRPVGQFGTKTCCNRHTCRARFCYRMQAYDGVCHKHGCSKHKSQYPCRPCIVEAKKQATKSI